MAWMEQSEGSSPSNSSGSLIHVHQTQNPSGSSIKATLKSQGTVHSRSSALLQNHSPYKQLRVSTNAPSCDFVLCLLLQKNRLGLQERLTQRLVGEETPIQMFSWLF